MDKMQELCTIVGNILVLPSAKKSDNYSREQTEIVFRSFNNVK